MAADDIPDWIETIARTAGKVGLNAVKIRWRLVAWHKRWVQEGRRASGSLQNVGYQHKICPECGTINDRAEKRCSKCEAPLGGRAIQVLRRLGLSLPKVASVSTLLVIVFLIAYVPFMRDQKNGALFSVDLDLLLLHGAFFRPLVELGEWWRVATAMFLHIGLWHLGFNVVAMGQVGPLVEEELGRARMLALFLVTGVAGYVGSYFWVAAPTAGASGGLMGLIGAAAAIGHRMGNRLGRDLRGQMVKWALYTMLFGYFIRANNVAHGAGFVVGALLGMILPVAWMKRNVRRSDALLALVGAVITLACLGIVLFPSAATRKRTAVFAPPAIESTGATPDEE